jgi:hypothetical protein
MEPLAPVLFLVSDLNTPGIHRTRRGRRDGRQAQITAVCSSIIDQITTSTLSPEWTVSLIYLGAVVSTYMFRHKNY